MTKTVIAVCAENAVHMICWTTLAIHFEKWWIAMFAVLVMTSIKNRDDRKKEV